MTPTINRLVTAGCVETQGGALGLNTLRYGPYFSSRIFVLSKVSKQS